MSLIVDPDTKDRVRAATDIVDLVGSYLELRRQGRGFVALCPWHADSRPSLQINVEKQIWKCWVCDLGGDVFSFVMQREGISFVEALRMLAERAGIAIQVSRGSEGSNTSLEDKQSMFRALVWASQQYHQALQQGIESKAARDYLQERGINSESINDFQLGFAPDAWNFLIDRSRAAGISPKVLEVLGLSLRGESGSTYERFRGRVIFPIRDSQKRVVAFGGRVLPGSDSPAKYLNSPESKVFVKHQHLYGLDLAIDAIRRSKEAIVMEGYTDVIIAHQFGVKNAVAVLGTALGASHLKQLRHLCSRVILLLDGDAAGQKRSDEVLELFLGAQMDVRVLTLPEDMDPADFLLARGRDALQALIDSAADALDFKMRRVCEGFDPLLETHRANAALEEMLALLAKVPRSGLMSDDAFRLRQDQILARLSRKFAVVESTLRARLTELRGKSRPKYSGQVDQAPKPIKHYRPSDMSPLERELLELLIVAPQLAPLALERVLPEWLECEAAREMFAVYHELELDAQSLEFDNVLNALEDVTLKSLLVILHEQAQAKQRFVSDTPEHRLKVLTERMGQLQEHLRGQQQLLELGSGRLDESEELSLLNDVIRQARQRQGLHIPPEDPAKLGKV